MNYLGKVKKYLESKGKQWYIVVASLLILEILNYDILQKVVPFWICTFVTVIILVLLMGYIGVMYLYVRGKYKGYFEEKKVMLVDRIDALEDNINEMNAKNIELENQLVDILKKEISDNKDAIINQIDSTSNSEMYLIKEKTAETIEKVSVFQTHFEETSMHISSNIENKSKEINKVFTDNQKKEHALISEQANSLSEKICVMEAELNRAIEEQAILAKEQSDAILNYGTTMSQYLNAFIEEQTNSLEIKVEELKDELCEANKFMSSSAENQAISILERISEASNIGSNLLNENVDSILSKIAETEASGKKLVDEKVVDLKAIIQIVQENINDGNNEFIRKTDQNTIFIQKQIKDRSDAQNSLLTNKIAELLDRMNTIHEETNKATEDSNCNIKQYSGDIISKIEEISEKENRLSIENINVISQKLAVIKNELAKSSEDSARKSDEHTGDILNKISEKSEVGNVLLSKKAKELGDMFQIMQEKVEKYNEEEKTSANEHNAIILSKIGEASELSNKFVDEKVNDLTKELDGINEKFKKVNDVNRQEFIEKSAEIVNQLAFYLESTEGFVKEQTYIVNKHFKVMDDNIAKVSEENRDISDKMIDKILSITDEVREEQKLLINNRGDEIHNAIGCIEEQVGSIQIDIERKTEKFVNDTTEIQNSLTNLLVQVLDNLDKNGQKIEKSYDHIFNQISDFSKNTKKNIEALKSKLEYEQQEDDKGQKIKFDLLFGKVKQINKSEDVIVSLSNAIGKKQTDLIGKLDNIEAQISNLNSLSRLVKNVSNQKTEEIKEINPNREERITDAETGMTILNTYKSNELVLSQMYSGNRKTYEVEYDKEGEMARSRNYDNKGNISTDINYYPSGQVKERVENIKVDGIIKSVKTKFDERGSKIN